MIVERSASAADGYVIGLYPLGSCVLHGLGAYGEMAARSLALERYELAAGSGRVLQSLDMSVLTGAIGPLLMVTRRDLVDILEACCASADQRRGVTVGSLTQDGGTVEAVFTDGTSGHFDAVVACDGMSSLTRERVFGPATGFDTGWALWTWWAKQQPVWPAGRARMVRAGLVLRRLPGTGPGHVRGRRSGRRHERR